MYEYVEGKIGGIAVFFNGALGGMVTPDVKDHSFEETKRIGVTTGKHVIRALNAGEEYRVERATAVRRIITFPLENEKFKRLRKANVLRRKIYNNKVLSEVCLIDLGRIQAVTIPGELLPKLGLRIKSMIKAKYRMLICLGNDELGYQLQKKY